MSNTAYESPFSARYASDDMQYLFSAEKKFRSWRQLWIVLAEAEHELGLPVSLEQIAELKAHRDDINYDVAAERERVVRHDVMAHVHAYGEQCPLARPIIHLGATSCYVGDNTDLLIMRDAYKLLRGKLLVVIRRLAAFADEYKALPTLGFTHFQPAQPTTVGKRACLWLQDLLFDLADVDYFLDGLRLLGSKGTTGTQASFLELFDGDHDKCRRLDDLIAQKLGFPGCYAVSGQTYSRKIDSRALNVLSGIAQSACKFSNDVRLLQHLKEVEEPFEKSQIGSSAMAYKRNPMRSERIAALSRYVLADALNPAFTAATQWFERTLDDSANRRLSVAEAFLAVDGILDIYANVAGGLVVYPKVIEKRLRQELPFMASENIMMDAVKAGGDRQELHERIREHSQAAGRQVKVEGGDNDLLARLKADPAFAAIKDGLDDTLDPARYVGRAPQQVDEFLAAEVQPVLAAAGDAGADAVKTAELKV
ncbi:MAG TPA: adenylosuccinate lyase [Lentisphaeria bacterium]|nr:adenylosuccinate lyase [Lentisphaeria bacterium]